MPSTIHPNHNADQTLIATFDSRAHKDPSQPSIATNSVRTRRRVITGVLFVALCLLACDDTGDPGSGGTTAVSYEDDQTNAAKTHEVPIKMWVSEGGGPVQEVVIGTIDVRVPASTHSIFGDFQFKEKYADLDEAPIDFHWINILQEYREDGITQTSHILVGALPAIDPAPSSDAEPYYYTEAVWTSGYYGGHQIHEESVRSMFADNRHLNAPSNDTSLLTFRTYLVVEDGSTSFCVLGGFEWKYSHTPTTGESVGIVGSLPSESAYIDAALTTGQNEPPTSAGYPGFPGYAPQTSFFCQGSSAGFVVHGDPWADLCSSASFALSGYAVGGAGDVNGDGIADLLCGAPASNGPTGSLIHAGTLFVYSGATGALLATLHGASAYDHFGSSAAGIGNVDGDGVPDYAVGAQQSTILEYATSVGAGYVQLRSGATGSLIRTITGDSLGDSFGASLAPLGDVDNDGTNDLAVGAPQARSGGNTVGMVRVISGASGATICSHYGQTSGDMLGMCVAGISDTNGDGKTDVVVGAPQLNTAQPHGSGYVRIVSGASGATLVTIPGPGALGTAFGMAIAKPSAAGGVLYADDLIYVGAPRHNSAAGLRVGAVYAFDRSSGILASVIEGPNPGDHLGMSITWLHDFDADGRRDIVIGAPQTGLGLALFGPGYTQVFSNGGLSATATFTGDESGDAFGAVLSAIGDLNGDGASELVIGAPLKDGCGYNGGGVLIHKGIPVTSPAVTFCWGDGSLPTPCPCTNFGLHGHGCDNSASTGGALLSATGSSAPDSVVLNSSGELVSALSIFLQGSANVSSGISFGDGVRCVAGSLKRLYTKNASGGTVSAPTGGDPSVTTQSAALGDPIAPGSTRFYQVYYRDPNLAFCAAPPGNSFNVSNGLQIVW